MVQGIEQRLGQKAVLPAMLAYIVGKSMSMAFFYCSYISIFHYSFYLIYSMHSGDILGI